MKVQLNFYDEKIVLDINNDLFLFKKEIARRFSMEYSDVEELIIQYINADNRRVSITNIDQYEELLKFASICYSKNKKYLEILIEVSEQSKLFQREMENSRIIPVQIDEKEKLRREIIEKEKMLKEILENDRRLKETKEVEELERKKKEEEEEEKIRLEKERIRFEEEVRMKYQEQERIRLEEEEKRRIEEQERMRIDQVEKIRLHLEKLRLEELAAEDKKKTRRKSY